VISIKCTSKCKLGLGHDSHTDYNLHVSISNLIFTGLEDTEAETESECQQNISYCLTHHLKIKTISIDTVHRLGEYVESRARPVKVKFVKQSDRQKVWENKMLLPPTIFIHEDSPKSTRHHHFILREAARKAREENKEVKVNWGKKKITISGKTSCILNDKLTEKEEQRTINQNAKPASSNSFLGKRPIITRSHKMGAFNPKM